MRAVTNEHGDDELMAVQSVPNLLMRAKTASPTSAAVGTHREHAAPSALSSVPESPDALPPLPPKDMSDEGESPIFPSITGRELRPNRDLSSASDLAVSKSMGVLHRGSVDIPSSDSSDVLPRLGPFSAGEEASTSSSIERPGTHRRARSFCWNAALTYGWNAHAHRDRGGGQADGKPRIGVVPTIARRVGARHCTPKGGGACATRPQLLFFGMCS